MCLLEADASAHGVDAHLVGSEQVGEGTWDLCGNCDISLDECHFLELVMHTRRVDFKDLIWHFKATSVDNQRIILLMKQAWIPIINFDFCQFQHVLIARVTLEQKEED